MRKENLERNLRITLSILNGDTQANNARRESMRHQNVWAIYRQMLLKVCKEVYNQTGTGTNGEQYPVQKERAEIIIAELQKKYNYQKKRGE